ncbi:MAG: TlpA disulfide reductase family protein [Bacteroidota bacterium]
MKKLPFILAALIVVAFTACQRKVTPKTVFTLKITVSNAGEEYILARYGERLDTFFLDSGKYYAELPFSQGTYMELQYGEKFFQVFGAPANDLQLSFDAGMEDPVTKFAGSLQFENEYVDDRRLFDEQQLDLENNLYTAGEEDFIPVNDSLRKIREQLFTESRKTFVSNVAEEFTYLEESLIKTKWINRYMEHELYFPLFTEQAEYTPSAKMLEYRKEIDPNNARLLVLDEYLGMLDYFIDIKKKEANQGIDEVSMSNLERMTLEFNTIEKNITNKPVVDEVKYKWVQKFLQTNGIEGAEKELTEYIQTVSDPIRRQELEADYKKWEALQNGEQSPEIRAVTMAGDSIKLSAYRGKYIYLDFWATWCKPCRDEIPFLEKLTADLKKDSIVVISVSLDEELDTWARIVRLKKMTGIQWFAEKDAVISAYNLASIPRYVIIDPQGKIVSANAERPSGNIREQLKQLSNGEI